ncbi:Rrf2 family transcriptional regulator [Klebsiella pneumoniae]|uniref:Rrf2 family transcriptional regulator n=1 Tax=Klebsiella TaxID=570 RepID=UPI0019C15D0E|nr:Rrf2 family transcriptional regulator [Klebsiella pneumoniae]HDU3887893.1 Rrf2 family transcriptional regulator [Klebsiella pneumoniae subsp. pneumoniae]MBD7489608.1 Rrf2 family transcriptional regulator [Klebsiella pneumoniae]MCX3086533.1 Rrf2 family transcriptional regulator [Klebsiella pneumoniae]MCX3091748.1 Rrf2 family transcriptional regulator [Klebsiella pneumoniae]MCX3096965.1 Rrf2 family transcriptional regulator [Klebsiella pneumoniae]
MKVAIEVNGEVIWYRDSETLEGMASLGYLKDGTQQKIIAALEDALFQAKGQMLLPDYVD